MFAIFVPLIGEGRVGWGRIEKKKGDGIAWDVMEWDSIYIWRGWLKHVHMAIPECAYTPSVCLSVHASIYSDNCIINPEDFINKKKWNEMKSKK